MAVLVGYVLVIGSSSVGHGWRLLTHLADQHHGSEVEYTAQASDTPHQHEGQTHTHERSDSDSQPAAVLTIALDKHCLFGDLMLVAPADRGHSAVHPVETWCHVPRSVETPPPRWLG